MIKIWRETFIVKEPYKIMCKCGLNLLTLIYLNKFCSTNLTQCTLSPSVPLAEKINVQIFLYPIQVTNIKFWFISPGPKKHILLVPNSLIQRAVTYPGEKCACVTRVRQGHGNARQKIDSDANSLYDELKILAFKTNNKIIFNLYIFMKKFLGQSKKRLWILFEIADFKNGMRVRKIKFL